MKKITFFLILFTTLTINMNAQIPNAGFENWTTTGSYTDPTYWGSTNSYSSGSFFAITKSTDHYPATVGNFSVRLENNPALNPNYSARGGLFTGPPPPKPNFAISGHPATLTGYYKFIPQNNDSMFIQIQLYYNGNSVAYGQLVSTTSAPSWSSFNIPISTYFVADSGSMIISAYNANGFNYIPHGNSVLYVDNLNFDNLITGIDEESAVSSTFSVYPNPALDIITIYTNNNNLKAVLNIYNIAGELVKSEKVNQNQQQINIKELANGIYTVELNSMESIEKQKLIIQK